MRSLPLVAALLCPLPAAAQVMPMPAAATTPGNPYEASVPLGDDSAQAQDSALREAFASVLAAVSGLPDVRTNPATLPLLDQASQYVQHYGAELDPVTRAPLFRAAFDQRAVDEALKRAGLPVFGLVAGVEQDSPVQISGVGSFRDYGRALGALKRLRGVKEVRVQAVEGDRVQVLVRFEGDAQALARAIASGAGNVLSGADGRSPLQLVLRPG